MFRLVYARSALERAQRQLERLRKAPVTGPDFPDLVPDVLDSLLAVTRQIDKEAKRRKKTHPRPAFDEWWCRLPKPVQDYRNAMLKGWESGPGFEQRTRAEVTLKAPSGASVTVHDVTVQSEDRTDIGYVREIVQVPERADVVWRFKKGPWDGQPVVEALDRRLRDLHDVIIPKAERLLT